MASTPRRYEAYVPVSVTQRCVLRLPLLKEEGIKFEAAYLIARYLEKCQVRLIAWNLGPDNHLHLIVSQTFDGHDKRREVGIAPFMRNMTSQLVRTIHEFHGTEGRITERTYRSRNLREPTDVIRAVAYVNGQKARHKLPARSARHSSAAVYSTGEPDGLVTHLPAFWESLGRSCEARVEIMRRLIADIIDRALELSEEEVTSPWALATEQAIELHDLLCVDAEPTATIAVHELLDPQAHETARQRQLDETTRPIARPRSSAPNDGLLALIRRRVSSGADPPLT